MQGDPGNYIDHASTHRVPCLVVSSFAKRGCLDSRHNSFPDIRRTMQLILGLVPLSRCDFGATPVTDCFEARAKNQSPFTATRFPSRQGKVSGAGLASDHDHIAPNVCT